jgi:hypothetical protein
MTRLNLARVLSLTCLLLLSACGRASFQTPDNFAKLAEHRSYQQRSTNPEGVVIAARRVDVAEPASLAFWSEAIVQRLRGGEGYALLGTRELRAKSGQAGKLMRFGRDQNGHTFDYWVAVFSKAKQLYLVEAGGRRDRFEKAAGEVERAIASLSIR